MVEEEQLGTQQRRHSHDGIVDASSDAQKFARDWPLTREEKHGYLKHLYDSELHSANNIIRDGEEAVQKLQSELQRLRVASTRKSRRSRKRKPRTPPAERTEPEEVTPQKAEPPKESPKAASKEEAVDEPTSSSSQTPREVHVNRVVAAEQAERLHRVILEATAALKGLLGTPTSDDETENTSQNGGDGAEPAVRRSKSEPSREVKPMPGALRRDNRRHSRDGKPLRVSFSREESVCGSSSSESDEERHEQADDSRNTAISEPEPDPGVIQAPAIGDNESNADESQSQQEPSEEAPSSTTKWQKKPGKHKRQAAAKTPTTGGAQMSPSKKSSTQKAAARGRGSASPLEGRHCGVPILSPPSASAASTQAVRDERAAPPPASSIDFL